MENTRERALPGDQMQPIEDHLVYLKHVALYEFAKKLSSQPQRILDLGCGEGYGAQILASAARMVVAADYSSETVLHAARKYAGENLVFVVCDAQRLPFRPDVFDMVVSFEVIEHLASVSRYLEEVRRVLTQTGLCLLSTPNRLLRLLPFQKPWNRFHLREYDFKGFAKALEEQFRQVRVCGVTAIPAILNVEKRRVKQNPFIAYPRMMAHLLFPRSVYDRLKPQRLAVAAPSPGVDFEGRNFSAQDFILAEDDLRNCITLVAICEQEPHRGDPSDLTEASIR